jgi:catechol 2,3-dioxygenase-like lactoylglutathione lyase family enzyme
LTERLTRNLTRRRAVFRGIHHITYIVWDLTGVRAYFAEHFGLTPVADDERRPGSPARLDFTIGETVLRFVQPSHPASMEYEQIRRAGGPVVSHVGLAVTDLASGVARLRASGVVFAQDDPVRSPRGDYLVIDLDPLHSCGMHESVELFGSSGSGADAAHGIRLQLCADAGAACSREGPPC